MTRFERPRRETLPPFLDMELTPAQTKARLVAPPSKILAEAAYDPSAEVWFIFDGDLQIGILGLIDLSHEEAELAPGDDPNSLLLWRLLIDAKHQRQGHGTASVEFTIERARALGRPKILLETVNGPQSPLPFYDRFGFKPTGRRFDDALELALQLA